jgi:hypothetical protein
MRTIGLRAGLQRALLGAMLSLVAVAADWLLARSRARKAAAPASGSAEVSAGGGARPEVARPRG